MHYRRIQLNEEMGGSGFENIIDESQVLTRKQQKEQYHKMKRFSTYIDDDLDTGLAKK